MTESSSCVFCNIIEQKTDTEILLENDKVVVFRDIKPASDFHFLSVPKIHINDTKSLHPENKELVLQMKEALEELMKDKNIEESEILLGFHVPPFNSVKHLHMHLIAPKSKMGFLGKMIFKPNSYWFRSVDYVINSIKETI